MAIIYAKLSLILFIANLIIKFYNAFAIHKAIGKQASITKTLLTGIFGIFSQTPTQLIAQIQEDETHYSDDNNTFHGNNNSRKFIQNLRRHSTDLPHITDHNDNNEPTKVCVDTNYKHYNTTIRRTEKGLQLRTLEISPKKRKPPLPERRYKQEPFRIEPFKVEPLGTISENKKMSDPPLPPQLITPPPAYQCLGTQSTLPSAPQLQQHSTQFNIGIQPYEKPQTLQKQSTPYEIPQPTNPSNTKQVIPAVKLMEIQNPAPIDFEQLKLTANKVHNRSHSLDIINNDDQPHTIEVTYCDTHSADTYEV